MALSPPLGLLLLGWQGAVAAALFAFSYLAVGWEEDRRGRRLPMLGTPALRRPPRGDGLGGAVQMMVGLTLVLVLFPLPYSMAAAAVLGAGDGLATVVGRRWGRRTLPWSPDKTWAGLLGGTVAAVPLAALYALIGARLTRAGFATSPGVWNPAWPWLVLAFLLLGWVGLLGVAAVIVRGRPALRYRTASAAETARAVAASLALPAAFLLTAPAFLAGPLLPGLGGHAGATKILLVLVPVVVMGMESALRRRDNLWVPTAYAVLAYVVVFLGKRL